MIIVYDPVAINYTYRSAEGPVGRHLRRIGQRIEAAAKAQVGKDTGSLAAAIYSRVTNNERGHAVLEVGADHPLAVIHHEGTKPHIITPNTVKVMKFSKGAKTVYAQVVMHPGTRPNRFLTDNLGLINS